MVDFGFIHHIALLIGAVLKALKYELSKKLSIPEMLVLLGYMQEGIDAKY